MNRIDRVTAILIQLQSKRIVKAQEIADRFRISLRTVYRDIKTLDDAGIPVRGEPGMGYSIMEGYRLPPVMFTKEEAIAFLTAEKLVEKLTDISTQQAYQGAMYKIKAILRLTEKDYLEDMDHNIEVVENQYVPKSTQDTIYLQQALQAISAKNILRIDYFANYSQKDSQRAIEPIGIYYMGEHWYLIAYCLLRKDYRTFKFSNISKLVIAEEHFDKLHPSLQTFLSKESKDKELHTVVLLVDKNIIQYFGDQKFYNGFVSQKDKGDKVEMIFVTASLTGFSRWYLLFGDHANIINPPELKDLVANLLESIAKKIK